MLDPKIFSLLKVYETGSFTEAAKQFSLTQPAVSKHIRMLEEELGVKLFVRSHNKLHTTHEGELTVNYAKRMVFLTNNLRQELIHQKKQIDSLSVGITHTAESNASAEALAYYVTSHQNVQVRIFTDTGDNLCSKLSVGCGNHREPYQRPHAQMSCIG